MKSTTGGILTCPGIGINLEGDNGCFTYIILMLGAIDVAARSKDFAHGTTNYVGETGGNCNIFHIHAHYVEHVFY